MAFVPEKGKLVLALRTQKFTRQLPTVHVFFAPAIAQKMTMYLQHDTNLHDASGFDV